MKLIATGYITDGVQDYGPGDPFEVSDPKEAHRLIELGVAYSAPDGTDHNPDEMPVSDGEPHTSDVGDSVEPQGQESPVADASLSDEQTPSGYEDEAVRALVEALQEIHELHHMSAKVAIEQTEDAVLLQAVIESDPRETVVDAAKAKLAELTLAESMKE